MNFFCSYTTMKKPNQLLIRSWVHPTIPQLDTSRNTISTRLFRGSLMGVVVMAYQLHHMLLCMKTGNYLILERERSKTIEVCIGETSLSREHFSLEFLHPFSTAPSLTALFPAPSLPFLLLSCGRIYKKNPTFR